MISTPKIQISGLHKAFGSKKVLDGINLEVAEQESLVIIGGSGTGKSVLLKCVLGLIEPDSGSIKVDGVELVGKGRRARRTLLEQTGMLFQGAALFDSLPVWRNVAFGLVQQGKVSLREGKQLAVANLKKVGLSADVADLTPAELSGGMQKRVGLARAIAAKPNVIFFDEPTTGLDPIMADVINHLIRDSVKDLGATALTITHDMASVRKIAHNVAMLYQGKVIWHGGVSQLDQCDNAYVLQFVNGMRQGPIAVNV